MRVAGLKPSGTPRGAAQRWRSAQIASGAIAVTGAAIIGIAWILELPGAVPVIGLALWTLAVVVRSNRQRRSADEVVRETEASEARKSAILDSALDAIISIDAHGTIVDFNLAAEAMFGQSRGDVIGTPLADALIPATTRDAHDLATLLASDTTALLGKRVEMTARRSDGGEFPVELSIARVGPDHPPMFTVFLRDITEPKRARTELIRSNERLGVLAGVSDAYATAATTYQLLLDKIARIMADLIGDGCFVTLLSDDGERLVNAANAHRDPTLELDYKTYLAGIEVMRRTSSSVYATVVRTERPVRADVEPATVVAQTDEALKPIVARLNVHSVAVVPIRVRQIVTGTLSLVRSRPGRSYSDDDVTLLQDLADRAGLAIENARLYAQLEQRVRERTSELEVANEELEAFSYSVAHDLRSPLRAISGFSHALLEDCADQLGAEGTRYANRIHDAARHMGQLIDGLLHLSYISRAELRRQRLDLSELARLALARLHAAHPDRNVDIIIEPGLAAHADRRLVEVALANLLGNAWKFTSRRPRARIEVAATTSHPITYFVRDNGPGFEPAHAEKLFGVFQRLHPDDEFEGTGIGLATVQRVIHSHGGRIWAEGAIDQGATFYFTLEPAPDRPSSQTLPPPAL